MHGKAFLKRKLKCLALTNICSQSASLGLLFSDFPSFFVFLLVFLPLIHPSSLFPSLTLLLYAPLSIDLCTPHCFCPIANNPVSPAQPTPSFQNRPHDLHQLPLAVSI